MTRTFVDGKLVYEGYVKKRKVTISQKWIVIFSTMNAEDIVGGMKTMKNVGHLDRTLRIVIGAAFLLMLGFVDGPWKYAGLLGVPLLFTGLAGTCFLYRIIGVSTCPNKTR